MDWIHCNVCYQQPASREDKFELTSCGHLLCSGCRQRADTGSCTICQKKCSLVQLVTPVEPFLLDPTTTLQKNLQAVKQVLSFQHEHRRKLQTHKLKVVEAHLTQAEDRRRHLEQENIALKRMVSAQQSKPRSSPAAVMSASVGRRLRCTPTQPVFATPPAVSHVAKLPSSSSSSFPRTTPLLTHLAQPSPRYVGRELTLQTPQSLGMRGSPMQH